MSKREKIIVSLACLAVLYGVYEWFLAPQTQEPEITRHAVENPSKSIQQFVIDIAQKLTRQELSPTERARIAQAGGKWTKDPFLQSDRDLKSVFDRPSAVATTEAATSVEDIDLTFSGYLELGNSRIAIINGMEYAEGETIDDEGHFVRRIRPSRVVIGKIGQNKSLVLPLDESGLSR